MGKYLKEGGSGHRYDVLAEATDALVTISLTSSMKQLLTHCAKANNMTVSAYCREVMYPGSYDQPLLPRNRQCD